MPRPITYDPALAHYWTAEGTGEITSRFFRPACRPNDPTLRRHVTDFTHNDPTDVTRCADCAVIAPAVA